MKKEGSHDCLASLTICFDVGVHAMLHMNEVTKTRVKNVAIFLRQLPIRGYGCDGMPSLDCRVGKMTLMYWIGLLLLEIC